MISRRCRLLIHARGRDCCALRPPQTLVSRRFRWWPIETRRPEIVVQALNPDVVFLADVLGEFLPCSPRDIPSYRPGSCVCAWIVDRGFVMHRVLVWPSYFFDDVQLTGMRMPPLIEPCGFVVTRAVDNQRISFPVPDRMAQICLAVDL